MHRILALAGLLTLGLTAARANDKPEPIATLVERLGSRDYKVREAAGQALEVRGAEALPELRKALTANPPAEARKRLATLVEKLDRMIALAPKRLTLKMIDRPVAEVVREIAKQTGYPIQFQGGKNVTVTVEMEKATFWEVLDHLGNIAGLTMYHNEGQGLVLYQNEGYWPMVYYQGPFKMVANNFTYNKTMSFGPIQRNPANNQRRSETLSFSFTLHAEPKLPLMSVGQARLLEVVDDLGNSMKPETGPHETMYQNYNGYRTFQYGSSVNLLWPNKEAKSVKRMRGVIPVTLLGEQKPEVVVEDVLKVKGKKFTGNTVEMQIDEVKEQNKTQYHFKMSLKNLAPNAAQDFSWTNSVHQRIEVFDAKGNKYFPQGYNFENSSPSQLQATFMFGNNGNGTLGAPAKLVYNHWSLLQHSIEFEFKDLMLP